MQLLSSLKSTVSSYTACYLVSYPAQQLLFLHSAPQYFPRSLHKTTEITNISQVIDDGRKFNVINDYQAFVSIISLPNR